MRTEPIFIPAIEGDVIAREVEALAHESWAEGELSESPPNSLAETVVGALGRHATAYEMERACDCWKLHVWEHDQNLPLGWHTVVRLFCQRAQASGAKSFSASVRAGLGAVLAERGWPASEHDLLVASKVWNVTKKSAIEPAEKPLPFDPETGEVPYPPVVEGEPHPHPEEWHAPQVKPEPSKPPIQPDAAERLERSKTELREWANEQARKMFGESSSTPSSSTPSTLADRVVALNDQLVWRERVRELGRLAREVQEIERRRVLALEQIRALGELIRQASSAVVLVDGGGRAVVIGDRGVEFLEVGDEA